MLGDVVIAGATGLVGRHLLDRLLSGSGDGLVHTIGRRRTGRSHPRLSEHEVDFRNLGAEALPAHHDLFCCLGTTLRKAGSPEAFRRVDYEFVLRLAKASKERGARQFLLVSSMGADPDARVLYSRTKGEVERDVAGLGFESLVIIRPSLLLGDRNESRPMERIATVVLRPLSYLMIGPLGKYRPIEADAVAKAMIHAARQGNRGVTILESDALAELADRSGSEGAE